MIKIIGVETHLTHMTSYDLTDEMLSNSFFLFLENTSTFFVILYWNEFKI